MGTTINTRSAAFCQGEYRAHFAHVDVPAELLAEVPAMAKFDADMAAIRAASGEARSQMVYDLDITPLEALADAMARRELPIKIADAEGDTYRAEFAEGFLRRYFWVALGF